MTIAEEKKAIASLIKRLDSIVEKTDSMTKECAVLKHELAVIEAEDQAFQKRWAEEQKEVELDELAREWAHYNA
jgi:hypothetical protein